MSATHADVGETITRQKRGFTLQAVAALRGWVACPTTTDHGSPGWILTRGAATREFASIEAAEAFLDGGASE